MTSWTPVLVFDQVGADGEPEFYGDVVVDDQPETRATRGKRGSGLSRRLSSGTANLANERTIANDKKVLIKLPELNAELAHEVLRVYLEGLRPERGGCLRAASRRTPDAPRRDRRGRGGGEGRPGGQGHQALSIGARTSFVQRHDRPDPTNTGVRSAGVRIQGGTLRGPPGSQDGARTQDRIGTR